MDWKEGMRKERREEEDTHPGFALTTSEEVREARARPEGGNAADRNAIGEPTEPLVRDLALDNAGKTAGPKAGKGLVAV
jgi:hypothetical protein